MALPGSLPLYHSQICAEFGVPITTLITQLVRGGGIVPNSPVNANIPTTPPIYYHQFVGAANYTPVAVTKSGNASGSQFRGEPAPSSVTVATNTVTITPSLGTGGPYTCVWVKNSGDASLTTPNNNQFSAGWQSSVNKNQEKNGSYTCTVSDGTSNASIGVTVHLQYTTDI